MNVQAEAQADLAPPTEVGSPPIETPKPKRWMWIVGIPGAIIIGDAFLGERSPAFFDVPGFYSGTGSRTINGIVIDFTGWLNTAFEWLKDTTIIFGLTFKDMMRWFTGLLDAPLEFMESLLTHSFGETAIPYLPWIVVLGMFFGLGWHLGGRSLALVAGGIILYLAVFGLWEDSMVTLSTVLVAAPLAGFMGMIIGIIAAKNKPVEHLITPVLNLMQSTPHLSYMMVIAVFIGISHKAGVVASMVFAMPPMTRLTILGLKSIPPEIIEAGVMGGATKRQMLFKVELPSARPSILLGANQTFVQLFGMVVLASLIGTRGLGFELLQFLRQLRVGEALQLGVAIILMAVLLDRLTRAAAYKERVHSEETVWWRSHPYLIGSLLLIGAGYALARTVAWARLWPEDWVVSTAAAWDAMILWAVRNVSDPLQGLTDPIVVWVLNPVGSFAEGLPWIGLATLVVLIGLTVDRWVTPVVVFGLVAFIAFAGYWPAAMVSLYLVTFVVLAGIIVGIPIGIYAAGREFRSKVVNFFLDVFQTMPSFVYLLPVIMLVRIGDRATMIAMFVFTAVPLVRYTIHGLQAVPHDKVEASITSGATPWQTLWKVRMPLAFPEIMLGLNQSTMFGLFMLMIAGFMGGTNDLGPELFKALTFNDAGKGLVVGLCIAAIGLAADQLIRRWARERKEILGIT